MPSTQIHPLACVEKGAFLGEGVIIEPFAVVKNTVCLSDGVTIKAHAYIDGHTTIGEGTTIYPSVSIGTKTQDLKYRGEKTFVRIGKNCDIREFVTINSSCQEGSTVVVGDGCLLMAYCHVAHNCEVGNHVIMSNGATLAGHVSVGDYAIIGGMTPVHQFCKIGCHAFVGGLSRVTHDVLPYTIGAGVPFKVGGLNLVGLKRRGMPLETRKILARAFRMIYRDKLSLSEALVKIENELPQIDEIKQIIRFCKNTERGLIGLNQEPGNFRHEKGSRTSEIKEMEHAGA